MGKCRRKAFQREKRKLAKIRKREGRASLARNDVEKAMHTEDRTFAMLTQNVRGFGATAAAQGSWLSPLGRRTKHGYQDVVLIQETHVETEEIEHYQREYAARWGRRTAQPFRSGVQLRNVAAVLEI